MSMTNTIGCGTFIFVYNPAMMRYECIPIGLTTSPTYVSCPHAEWSFHCSLAYSNECLRCPIYKNRGKTITVIALPTGME